ncbi:MAG: TonB-dependent receptor [Gammaproteobacteria bacterium]
MTAPDPALVRRPQTLRRAGVSPTSAGRNALALGISAALASGLAHARDGETIELDTLQIEERTIDTNPYAQPGAPYKARVSGDRRHVKELAETPQTITVLTQTQIQESGRSDLKEILQAQPGITIGTGENGNAFGDRYVIRGHEARSDVFVDGLRDPGMTTRESFATEQLEVTKGPSSTFAGRGSTGGAINSVTKQASSEYDFTRLQGAGGTDDYRRFTVDSNQKITDAIAARINLLHAYEEVPDRDPADRERNGAAVSGAWTVNERLRVVADYYFLDASDDPDLGTYIVPGGGAPVDDLEVYTQDEDFLETEIHTATLRIDYRLTDWLDVQNATRYGVTDNGYVLTGARGNTRHASDPFAPGVETVSLSTHQGWQEVDYVVNQTNFFAEQSLFGMRHQGLFSVEYSDLGVRNGVFNVTNAGATNCVVSGRGGAAPGYCLVGPGGQPVADVDDLLQRQITRSAFDSDYDIETVSVALMDTIDLTEQFALFLGVRMDSFDYANILRATDGTITPFEYSDTLWNGHAGLVYQFMPMANVYFTWSTSANINGGESDVGGSCGYGGLCGDQAQVPASQPEQTENLELGTKWNLFGGRLLATAALFQITKDDVMESVGNAYATLGTLNTGKNRVRGMEFSVVGNITRALSTQFGAARMSSEILDSFNLADIGRNLANFADDSLFWQLRYQFTPQFAVGTTVSYKSKMFTGQPDTAAGFDATTGTYAYEVPSYTVLDLFASWDFSEQLQVRVNVGNVTDEDYYLAAYRSGAFAYIGDARNARVALTYAF